VRVRIDSILRKTPIFQSEISLESVVVQRVCPITVLGDEEALPRVPCNEQNERSLSVRGRIQGLFVVVVVDFVRVISVGSDVPLQEISIGFGIEIKNRQI